MPESLPGVHLFARGWEYACWSGGFYPEDLPDEWRLTYYANEFRGVLVPAERWQSANEEVLLEWIDDVHEDFLFYIELTQAHPTPEEEAKVVALGRQFVAWVWPQRDTTEGAVTPCRLLGVPRSPDAFLLDAAMLEDLKQQKQLLERLATGANGERSLPLFLQGAGWPVERLRQMSQLSQLLGLA